MLPKHLNVEAIVLDRALLWAAMDAALSQGPLLWRHNDKTIICLMEYVRTWAGTPVPGYGFRGPSID